jgi:hypothetical protein
MAIASILGNLLLPLTTVLSLFTLGAHYGKQV